MPFPVSLSANILGPKQKSPPRPMAKEVTNEENYNFYYGEIRNGLSTKKVKKDVEVKETLSHRQWLPWLEGAIPQPPSRIS